KTAALLAAAASVGAILGGAGEPAIAALRGFGGNLGIAFQAIDDILGIWGDPGVTGKPAANDLRQRKKTIPVAHALGSIGGEELGHLLSNGELTEDGLRRGLALIESSGGREWTLDLAERHFHDASAALETASLAPEAVEELRELARFVVGRDF
ncbi:MAG TPA: polyprenyl synthetase family protein, partial [Actinomycetota bacterium]